MNHDLAPRWDAEPEDEDVSPSGELAEKRTLFQQELLNILRPTELETPDDDTEEDEVDSSEKKKKQKSPKGWRNFFRNLVKKDSPEEQVNATALATGDKTRETRISHHDQMNEVTEDYEGELRIVHDENLPKVVADRETKPQNLRFEVTEDDMQASKSSNSPEDVPQELTLPKHEAPGGIADQVESLIPPPLRASQANKQIDNEAPAVIAPIPVVAIETQTKAAKVTHQEKTSIFEQTKDFIVRRKNRRARKDVERLKRNEKQQDYRIAENIEKDRLEHSQLHRNDQRLQEQVRALETSQQQNRETLHAAAEVRAQRSNERTPTYSIDTPPPIFAFEQDKPKKSKETESEVKRHAEEPQSLAEKYSLPPEERPQKEAARAIRGINEQSKKPEAAKPEEMPEKYFDSRHEVMDEAKKKTKKQPLAFLQPSSKSSQSDQSSQHQEKREESMHSKKSFIEKNFPGKTLKDAPEMYVHSVQYGIGSGVALAVLALIASIVR